MREIVSCWDLKFRKSRPELDIAGSPERTAYRLVIEDEDCRLWVLEAVPPHTHQRKTRISEALAFLERRGLRSVHPHLPGRQNERVIPCGKHHWQLRPYVPGVPLPRPSYVLEGWRGRACARFLENLREKARELPGPDPKEAFCLSRFIQEMSETMERYDPGVHNRLGGAFRFIEREFAGREGDVEIAFCHGDFHPLNVIWSEDGIRSVIDWEFLGYKPEVYDAANLIGCVGFEDPAALDKGLVRELISRLRRGPALSRACREALPEWVVAIRFAWLSDWLRRGDPEMVDLEITYIHLLIEHCRTLKDLWKQIA